jgi:hypothetical protein
MNGNCVQVDANGNLTTTATSCSTVRPIVCDLKTQMDTHYGVGVWSYYTAPGKGTDIGPALSECITTFVNNSGSRGVIYVPSTGIWAMTTSDIDFSGVYIVGDGSQASKIIYRPSALGGHEAFTWKGTGGLTGGGMRGIGALLDSTVGAVGNGALLFQGNATFQPDQMELDDVYISAVGGVSTWGFGLICDGTARTAPQGLRVGSINN